MTMNIDEKRAADAAQSLLIIAEALADAASEEMVAERQDALRDAWVLLERLPDHPETRRLRGVVRAMQGDEIQAIDLLYQAFTAGDFSVLVRLEDLLRRNNRRQEADEIAARIETESVRGNGDVLWSIFREGDDDRYAQAKEPVELLTRAAESGHEKAADFLAQSRLDRGDPRALRTLRGRSDSAEVATLLGKHLLRFELTELSIDNETSESRRLLEAAHEQGLIEATVLLWLHTEPPADQQYADLLAQFLINLDRVRHLASIWTGGAGAVMAEVAQELEENAQELVALRLYLASAAMGFDGAVALAGSLLQSQAGNEGPWAVLGAFLRQWPTMIRSDLVGAPEFPLDTTDREPALRDDHSAALEIADSDFARRIREVLEQVGWNVFELGDHLLVGHWQVESGPVQIYFEISGGGDADRFAQVSTPLLVGLDVPIPPWGAPETTDVDVHGWDGMLDSNFRGLLTSIGSFAGAYVNPQRRVLEALFRVGENDSREQYLDAMGFFGMSLGGMLGRRMTFGSCPEHRYPQAWASVSMCDYISTSSVHEVPEFHRCQVPIPVVNVGYTLTSELSGEHLKDVIGGTVHSLMHIQDYVTEMFDHEPAVFNEILNAVPMTRIEDHRDLYEGDIPNPTRTMGGNSSEIRDSLEAIKGRHHRIVADPNSDPLDINNAAFYLLHDGFIDEAMVGFDRAASMGQPNALATLIWQLMLQGDARRAVAAFEDYFPRIDDWRAQQEEFIQEETYPQSANCMSNAGLAYAALDHTDTALRLWVEAAADDHVEAKAYPGVLLAREGDTGRALKMFGKLTASEQEAFRHDMEEVLEQGSAWFEAWARDALDILDRT